MNIDLSDTINRLKVIQDKFNTTNDPVERLALLTTINHIAKHELPFDEDEWVFQQYYKASLRVYGAKVD